jgi:predicted O-linked N-acetylglucosamine transferase (SPINDLY family)
VLASHDRGRFAVTCYSDTRVPDGVTAQLRGLPEQWRDVASLDDAQLAATIEADQIDILVELAGHTNRNRLPLLAQRRLAPVQVTYLGYPNTTGLTTIDYRITDSFADPPDMTDGQYTERLVRLDAFFTSVRLSEAPEVGPLPAAAEVARGQVTFGVISTFPKVREPAMRCWADILHALANARLLIQAKAMDDPPTREAFRSFFRERGIAPERIECRGWSSFPDFLRLLNERIDIVLDTWPFAGHTTTCHALLMGVPVITRAGDAFRGRMGASILTHVGLPELIADDDAGYVRCATALASDVPRLAGLRVGVRERLLSSVIHDHAGFTRRLEAAYEWMARERSSGRRD